MFTTISRNQNTPHLLTSLTSSAIISAALVLPLAILQLINLQQHEFPFLLFGLMWVLFFSITVLARSAIVGIGFIRKPIWRLLQVVALLLVSVLAASLIADQMPCYLGVPNCD